MIKSYSKINLFLKVLKRNKKKLHNIQSYIMLLDLYDEINIKNGKKDKIKFIGQFKQNISKSTNSISQSLSLLRKHNLIKKEKRYEITIRKKIPVFGGLGGGTSNAAFLVKYFLKKKISIKLLAIFEKKIGSDFRIFFLNQSYQKSLKNIKKLKKNYLLYFILLYPNIKCSTKKIYSKVKKFSLPLKRDPSNIQSKDRFIYFIKNECNDLQKIVVQKHIKISFFLDLIKEQKNCLFSRMTGSGSVCFGVFPDKKSASQGLRAIKKKLPNYWSVLTKSI